ncbi:MAG: tRNA 4-thiouridine(8) synthase ThiI [Oscillospiraceae bacterium]|nr:tRNA 4-thiouridine(8) synthase ThiI [Oscillospiraceae bacterium]
MREIILIKYGEIILKGLNRSRFEDLLIGNIKKALPKDSFKSVRKSQAITYVEPDDGADVDDIIARLQKIFGIVFIARAGVFPKDMDVILKEGPEYLAPYMELVDTFKVEAKRSDKKFPFDSPAISREMGGAVLRRSRHLKVNVAEPGTIVRVEIRENEAYVYADIARVAGPGGMPTGSNGRATLLLSGGIDSPVAGYMLAKRGVELNAVHFFSPPYTSDLAKEKVIELGRILAGYTGKYSLYIVPFTEQQLAIRDNCPEEHLTLIMRRMMMMVAERLAKKSKSLALITGESLGQVASQTIHALGVTNEAVKDLPVFRPLVGMDKDEIVSVARKIGTFETSILPYEDCCTVFVPKHPTTKPVLGKVLQSQSKIDMEYWVNKAVDETEWVLIEG